MPDTQRSKEPKWRRLPEERPQQIIEAALEVFGEHGLESGRLDDVARRAGVAKGTIYLYFPNKEDLFREMIRQTVVARLDVAEQQVGALTGTATEQLREYIGQWWHFLCSPAFQTIYRLVHAELHRFPELAQFYAQNVVARSHRIVAGLIRRGVDSGEFRPVDCEASARILAMLLISHSVLMGKRQLFKPPAAFSGEQVLEQVTDFYLHALRAYPAPASGARPEHDTP
jgi:AcrR family transcriptional regulator